MSALGVSAPSSLLDRETDSLDMLIDYDRPLHGNGAEATQTGHRCVQHILVLDIGHKAPYALCHDKQIRVYYGYCSRAY